nr:phenoloxidase 2 [Onthophagus taurus]
MANKNNLLLLYDRPLEPSFVPKGPERKAFDVQQDLLPPKYQGIGVQLANRFGEDTAEKIPLKKISVPNLGEILDLPRQANFSLFIPKHRRIAGRLINIFLGMKTIDDLQSMAVYARDRVNPYLFNYCLSVAILHRPDTQDLDLPAFVQSFPDKFLDGQVFQQAREEVSIVPDAARMPIEIPRDYTASDLEEEHRLAYFREDLGINLHHWHWHLVYPFEGAMEVVNKDRRGELFYYMHQQVIARFNLERFSNNMGRVTRWNEWKEPIKEAYFPKLDSLVASRAWPARVENQSIKDLNREQDQIQQDVDDLYRWRDRIFEAIHSGRVQREDGSTQMLTETEGIDILGNMVESSILSPNRTLYGDLHNMGHVFISYAHDPDHRHLESFGVMGDSSTAMRDPIFYRWHAYIDDIFQEHKSTLPRYTTQQLDYPGVTVTGVAVNPQGGTANNFSTFWQQSDVDFSRGMDFQPRGSVFARFTHLQHQPFTYNITVNNSSGANRMGTCRIFLGPKFDERKNPWLFRDQRLMFIELDRFVVTLQQGENTIRRNSNESSVTIPFERTFRNLDLTRPVGGDQLAQFNFCGCGWPQHMLIPKGTADGLQCQLFVMISNFQDDTVNESTTGQCNDAMSFCGIKDRKYPDKRSMGYPFDRMPRDGVNTLQQFLTPNMRVQDCLIKHNNRVVRPRAN